MRHHTKWQFPTISTATLLVATVILSVVARDHAIVATNPTNEMRTLNLIVAATHIIGRAFALTPLHVILTSTPDARTRNGRARDGLLAALVMYGIVAVAGNAITMSVISGLEIESGTTEFSNAVLYTRTQTIANVIALILDYVVIVLATLGRTHRANIILATRLFSIPVTTAAATYLDVAYAARVDAIVGIGCIAYILSNVRRWDYDGTPADEPITWLTEYVVTGLFSGLSMTLVILAASVLANNAAIAGQTHVEATLRLAVVIVTPVIALAENIKLRNPKHREVDKMLVTALIYTTAVAATTHAWPTIAAIATPTSERDAIAVATTLASIGPALIALSLHIILSAAFAANGLTPVLAISTLVGTTGFPLLTVLASQHVTIPDDIVVSLAIGGGMVAALAVDAVLLVETVSYLNRTSTPNATERPTTT